MQHKDEEFELSYELNKESNPRTEQHFDLAINRSKRLNLIGWPLTELIDLEWLRTMSITPILSLMHVVYISQFRTVLLHTAISSISPFSEFTSDSCLAYNPERILKTAEALEAKEFFILINNPDGNPDHNSENCKLAESAAEKFKDIFSGVIIVGENLYSLIDGYGKASIKEIIEYEGIFKLKIHSAEEMALHAFKEIFNPHRYITIQLGTNEDNRIIFWAFNNRRYPNHLNYEIIEALGGTEEYILTNKPNRLQRMGEDTVFWDLDSTEGNVENITVELINIYKVNNKHKINFLSDGNYRNAKIINPEILCGRLLTGSMFNIKLYSGEDAELLIEEEDMVPEEYATILRKNMPVYKTPFGFISEPENNKNPQSKASGDFCSERMRQVAKNTRSSSTEQAPMYSDPPNKGIYYAILKDPGEGLILTAGVYSVSGESGECLESDWIWKIRYNLVEGFFYNKSWNNGPIRRWKHETIDLTETLDYLTMSDLNKNYRKHIAGNSFYESFLAVDWSPEFYRAQAALGFIAITSSRYNDLNILTQLQKNYSVLDWENLKYDKKVENILNGNRIKDEKIQLKINSNPKEVLENLLISWGDSTWISPSYVELIKELASVEEQAKDPAFRVWGVTLSVGEEQIPVAGELGYSIGKTYTSLSGFFKRDVPEYNNFGKLQMVMLAEVLQDAGIAFWNLGHPYMEYKTRLGARTVPRKEFLERWDEAVEGEAVDLAL